MLWLLRVIVAIMLAIVVGGAIKEGLYAELILGAAIGLLAIALSFGPKPKRRESLSR